MDRPATYAPRAHGLPLSGLLVRPATQDDVPGIARVDEACLGLVPEEIEPRIAADLARIAAGESSRRVFVAEAAGAIRGYAKLDLVEGAHPAGEDLPQGWYLMGIGVLPEWRRRGLGRALVAARLAVVGEAPCFTFTTRENLASIALNQGFGFEEVGESQTRRGPRLLFRR